MRQLHQCNWKSMTREVNSKQLRRNHGIHTEIMQSLVVAPTQLEKHDTTPAIIDVHAMLYGGRS